MKRFNPLNCYDIILTIWCIVYLTWSHLVLVNYSRHCEGLKACYSRRPKKRRDQISLHWCSQLRPDMSQSQFQKGPDMLAILESKGTRYDCYHGNNEDLVWLQCRKFSIIASILYTRQSYVNWNFSRSLEEAVHHDFMRLYFAKN